MNSFIIVIFGWYALAWSIPGGIILFTISHGNIKHIISLDKILAKNIEQLYDSKGQLIDQLSVTIGTRYIKYLIKYPFIRSKNHAESLKFRAFMWINSLWVWSWVFILVLMLFDNWI
ncbi:hypothetical protein NMT40_003601 [Vibrio cholerae]|nr:hypothetical protein [Vibrio cholerae]EKG0005911.1 hypothetical protein [Vibrio cholerae]